MLIEGDNIWIRETPVNGKVILKLNTGDKCVVLEKGSSQTIRGCYDYWYKIKYNEKVGWVFGSQTSIKTTESQLQINFMAQWKPFLTLLKTNRKQIQKYIHPKYKLRYIEEGSGVYSNIRLNHSFDLLTEQVEELNTFINELSKIKDIPIIYDDGKLDTFKSMTAYVNTEKVEFSRCSDATEIMLKYQHEIDIDSEEFKKTQEYKALEETKIMEKQIKKEVKIDDFHFYFMVENSNWYVTVIDAVNGL